MTDQLISFETTKLALSKGFGPMSFPTTMDIIPYRVTQSLLQKWLREEHLTFVNVFLGTKITYGYRIHNLRARDIYEDASGRIYHKAEFTTYEEALEQGLIEALKLIP